MFSDDNELNLAGKLMFFWNEVKIKIHRLGKWFPVHTPQGTLLAT